MCRYKYTMTLCAWETSVLPFLGCNRVEAESGQEMNLVSLFSFCLSSLWTELCLKAADIFIWLFKYFLVGTAIDTMFT